MIASLCMHVGVYECVHACWCWSFGTCMLMHLCRCLLLVHFCWCVRNLRVCVFVSVSLLVCLCILMHAYLWVYVDVCMYMHACLYILVEMHMLGYASVLVHALVLVCDS